ncbi:MAG: ribonuclease Z [Bacteroidales bacterium]|nr:ribonuclease Z [Bacteroidales bacterium]
MNFYTTILGSGAALPTGGRHCSAQMLNINGFRLLIDCAEGTQLRMRECHQRLQSVNTILISHLHGDHCFGLPGLLSTLHLCGRTDELTIVCPTGLQEALDTLFSITGNHIDYHINYIELQHTDGRVCCIENKHCLVEAFPLVHTVPTYGFKITEKPRGKNRPRTYAYCCDTAFDPRIATYVEGVDLLCTECTFANELASLAEQRLHLTAGQAATIATQAGVGQLLLTHISARYKDPSILLQQASQVYANTLIAADGDIVEVKTKNENSVPKRIDNENDEHGAEKNLLLKKEKV